MNRLEKIAKGIISGFWSKAVNTRDIKIQIVDFTNDKDEPAYDVNVYVDGKAVTGGKVFSTALGTDRALREAESFVNTLIRNLVRATGGTL